MKDKMMSNRGSPRNTLHWPEPKCYPIQYMADDKGLSKNKAKEILHDGTVHGKPITKKQRGYFGAVASGKSRKY